MQQRSLVIGDKTVSRFRASWLLLRESWRFLRTDTELLLVPVLATILLVFLFGILIIGVLVSGVVTASSTDASWTAEGLMFIVGSYLIAAFVVALARAMVVHTVAVRAAGNDATLGQSMKVAFRHIPTLFLWALINATVGVALRFVAERFDRFGRILTGLFGAAWGILTYFVVPAIVISEKNTKGALLHSAQVFRTTWGESLVINVSLGLVFLLLHLIAMGLFLAGYYGAVTWSLPALFIVIGILYTVILFSLLALQQVLESIVVTLLYLYATSDVPPKNFNTELLGIILARQTTKELPTETVTAS